MFRVCGQVLAGTAPCCVAAALVKLRPPASLLRRCLRVSEAEAEAETVDNNLPTLNSCFPFS